MQANFKEELKGVLSYTSLIFFHIFVLFFILLIEEIISLYFVKKLDFNIVINTISIPANIITIFFIGFFTGRHLNWSELYGKSSEQKGK